MKVLMMVLCLGFISSSYAEETPTDCPAMNESRETSVKVVAQDKKPANDSSAVKQ